MAIAPISRLRSPSGFPARAARQLAAVAALLGVACGPGCGGEGAGVSWPMRVTLHTSGGDGERVRLVDGVVSERGGDVKFAEARVFSLGAPSGATFCEKGNYDSLGAVPTDEGACLRGSAAQVVYLGGDAFDYPGKETASIGLGILVRDATDGALYRLRILAVGNANEGAMVTFEYEPVR